MDTEPREATEVFQQLLDALDGDDPARLALKAQRDWILERDEYDAPEFHPEWMRMQQALTAHCGVHPRRDRLIAIFNRIES